MSAIVRPNCPRLLLCIIKYINTLRDILYFEVVALDLIMRRQEVEGMDTCTPCLEVVKQHIFSDVSIESLRVSEFLHPRFFDEGEDELHSLSPRRLVGTAFGALGFVRGFRARTDDGRGIIVDCCIVSVHSCGFDEFRFVAHCVRCHRPNEADDVVCASRFVVWDLE